MNKKNVYVVSHTDIYEHNMSTIRELTAPKICWTLEEAQDEMKAMAKKGLINFGFTMDGDSEEAVLNRKEFEKIFTIAAFKEADKMKFNSMWFVDDICYDQFIIEILPSYIDLDGVKS